MRNDEDKDKRTTTINEVMVPTIAVVVIMVTVTTIHLHHHRNNHLSMVVEGYGHEIHLVKVPVMTNLEEKNVYCIFGLLVLALQWKI